MELCWCAGFGSVNVVFSSEHNVSSQRKKEEEVNGGCSSALMTSADPVCVSVCVCVSEGLYPYSHARCIVGR